MRWIVPAMVVVALSGCHEETGSNACIGVTCSGHGTCVLVDRNPRCECDEGYAPDGLGCVPVEADGDADADGDVEGDGDVDADGPVASGPMVLVVERGVVTPERRCDVDGDGSADNAIAALGAADADLFALAVNSYFVAAATEGDHVVLHLQWVEDLSGPSTSSATMATYVGVDTDFPIDPSDDFSGTEPFYVGADGLDGCGEPQNVVEGLVIEEGLVTLDSGTLSLVAGSPLELSVSQATGTIAPGGATFTLAACGYVPIEAFGQSPSSPDPAEPTLLEIVVAGAGAFGLDLPGIEPDVDLDGDGLERLMLDADDRIDSCVDGDRTIIEGRDCWRDPRIADAFALSVDLEGVSARFGGREPGWEYEVPIDCEEWPLPGGFFSTSAASDSACVGFEEQCDPRAARPCCDPSHSCSGADGFTYRCYEPCEPSPCFHGPGLLGACVSFASSAEPLCWAVTGGYRPTECDVGSSCTTGHGVSENTACVEVSIGLICAELCDAPAAPCAEGHRCVPLAFEPGGVCAFR